MVWYRQICVASHNQALEKLTLVGDGDNRGVNSTALTWEQRQPLQCLSNGYYLLKEIDFQSFSNCKLSTYDVIYLVNHSIRLENVRLYKCNICDDGFII